MVGVNLFCLLTTAEGVPACISVCIYGHDFSFYWARIFRYFGPCSYSVWIVLLNVVADCVVQVLSRCEFLRERLVFLAYITLSLKSEVDYSVVTLDIDLVR